MGDVVWEVLDTTVKIIKGAAKISGEMAKKALEMFNNN
jgi:hypothetical protein